MVRRPEVQTNSQHSASSAADPCPITEIAVVCRRPVAVHNTNDHINWNRKVEQKFWLTVLKPFFDAVIDRVALVNHHFATCVNQWIENNNTDNICSKKWWWQQGTKFKS
ncbi:hypothetical protein B0H17DRAFT_1132932 [Mycena rosella]|uniref:Uncharacterized protein n=1 Tax=Mycena rosella TaxID=1033263 RepID=A0AAD7DJB1_MYCRO|nr:hypothetical protein B0H17DRAFT_1132932 [Mycena rosella]